MKYNYPPAYFVTDLERIINKWKFGNSKNPSAESICFPSHPGVILPVPFFGNIANDKPRIFTIGSNPSDKEFIDDKGNPLKSPRFFRPQFVSPSWGWRELFEACNEYFVNSPYTRWFGKHGTRIEGFLNLLDASYYDTSDYQYQAVHVDLMPFPTEEKFASFKKTHPTEAKEYINSYGIPLVYSLISLYKPELIVCIGTDACNHLLGHPAGAGVSAGKAFKYYKGEFGGVKAFGTSIYYPNSYGSSPRDWEKDIVPLI